MFYDSVEMSPEEVMRAGNIDPEEVRVECGEEGMTLLPGAPVSSKRKN